MFHHDAPPLDLAEQKEEFPRVLHRPGIHIAREHAANRIEDRMRPPAEVDRRGVCLPDGQGDIVPGCDEDGEGGLPENGLVMHMSLSASPDYDDGVRAV